MGQDSIVMEEMLALLAFLFKEYGEFYEAVLKFRDSGLPPPGALWGCWKILIRF